MTSTPLAQVAKQRCGTVQKHWGEMG